MIRLRFIFYFILSAGLTMPSAHSAEGISPNHVFAEAERIYADVQTIKAHYKISSLTAKENIKIKLNPRHVWQKTYEVLVKLNIYHRFHDYPNINPGSIEPIKDLPPALVYDQTQRILVELKLIKRRLHISTPTPKTRHYRNKEPTDVYNVLSRVSRDIDMINAKGLTPSDVFAQAFRINSDIDLILHTLAVEDDSIPPAKHANSQPQDAFKAGMALKKTINKLQRQLSITVTDFSNLKYTEVKPSHVFALIGLITAELQEIKFALSLNHQRTPAANFYRDKIPADVEQLLGWCNNKLMQIHTVQL